MAGWFWTIEKYIFWCSCIPRLSYWTRGRINASGRKSPLECFFFFFFSFNDKRIYPQWLIEMTEEDHGFGMILSGCIAARLNYVGRLIASKWISSVNIQNLLMFKRSSNFEVKNFSLQLTSSNSWILQSSL